MMICSCNELEWKIKFAWSFLGDDIPNSRNRIRRCELDPFE
jgi:hypothetical protein